MASSEKDFKSFQSTISTSLVNTTRTVGQIAAEDLAFHRSSDPSIAQQLETQNARLLALVRRITRSAVIGTDVQAPGLPQADAVEDQWQRVVDVVDNLLEKTDSCLDEYTGVIKRQSPAQRSTPVPAAARKSYPAKELRYPDIAKPQLLFRKIPDNQEITAFKPLLRTKPHATVPLKESISPLLSEEDFQQYDTQFYLSMTTTSVELRDLIDSHFRYRHPYETEITQLTYPPHTYEKSVPIPPLPLESTTAIFVDTMEAVEAMLAELKAAKEIAVDLEHHDTHSYVGIVSLMQISTREKDWVVDTLKPWREDLQILNEVFADPKIVKVCLVSV
jgi:exosome complex exonuclease RRP6